MGKRPPTWLKEGRKQGEWIAAQKRGFGSLLRTSHSRRFKGSLPREEKVQDRGEGMNGLGAQGKIKAFGTVGTGMSPFGMAFLSAKRFSQ